MGVDGLRREGGGGSKERTRIQASWKNKKKTVKLERKKPETCDEQAEERRGVQAEKRGKADTT